MTQSNVVVALESGAESLESAHVADKFLSPDVQEATRHLSVW